MGSYTNLHFISISSINSISISGYRQRKRDLPIYIKSGHISLHPLTPQGMLQTPPDTTRHGPDTSRYHHTRIMYGLYGLKHHIVAIRFNSRTWLPGRKKGDLGEKLFKSERNSLESHLKGKPIALAIYTSHKVYPTPVFTSLPICRTNKVLTNLNSADFDIGGFLVNESWI